MCQLHMCSVWVQLGVYHWLINLQQHEWFGSNLGPLGLERDRMEELFAAEAYACLAPEEFGADRPRFW